MTNISCFIIAKNEERLIARAIKSVKNIAEEIIVIDSGSTDKTIEIAKSLGTKVIHNDWNGYLNQKIYGEALCKNEWIINIDADEEITKDLEEEIIFISSSGLIDKYKAYRIDFGIIYREEEKLRFLAPSNTFIRLYNKNFASFGNNKGDSTHDDVKLNPGLTEKKDVYVLAHKAFHRSGASITQLVNKANFYSSEQAKALAKKGRAISKFRIICELPFWFFKAFIIRRYFIFGFDGFVDSWIFAFARFMRLAKVREENNDNNKSR